MESWRYAASVKVKATTSTGQHSFVGIMKKVLPTASVFPVSISKLNG